MCLGPVGNEYGSKLRNENYEKDIVYVVKHNKWVLRSLGIWPEKSRGAARFLPYVTFTAGNAVLLFATVPCILHIFFEEKELHMRLSLAGLVSFCLIAMIKYAAFTARKRLIKKCIAEMEHDWMQVDSQNSRELMLKCGKMGRDLTIISAVFMYSSGAIYHTILQYAIDKFIGGPNSTIKPMVYPTYSNFFDAQRTPVYEIVYILHCMCGYVIYSVTTGVCGLAALFAMHVCGQIDVAVAELGELVDRKCHSDPTTRLIKIVERHLKALRFSATVETILQEVCLFEFFDSIFLICVLEYYILKAWEEHNTIVLTSYVLLLMSLTFNIFTLCYIGEVLMQKTSDIGVSCFLIDWYYLPAKTIQSLILIIAMSRSPAKISAGKIVDLNLFSFANVLKTSVAYLSFLRTSIT